MQTLPSHVMVPLQELTELTLFQEPVAAATCPVPWRTRFFKQRIPAGFPSPAADYTEDGLDLNAYRIPHRASTFIFTVVGWSMKHAGILDGDKVTVDRAIEPRHGHIVIAVVNNEYTLKRLFMRQGIVELRAENPEFPPIRFSGLDELHIWGVVTGVLRKVTA